MEACREKISIIFQNNGFGMRMKREKKEESKNYIWRRLLIILGWLLIWEILARVIDNRILLEGPVGVFKRLCEDLMTVQYHKTVAFSVLRIMSGLLAGLVLAIILGAFSYKYKFAEELFLPVIQILKAAPITCFVVLLLIWAGAGGLAFYVALLVVFPPLYFNLLEGLKQLDEKELEVAKVYRMPFKNRLRFIYLPGIRPYFQSALAVAVGMAFKAGIAAEIIGTPKYSMGERIYMSKIYLDTAGVLSWMITVILVSYLCEKIIVKVAEKCFSQKTVRFKVGKRKETGRNEDIHIENCTLSYGDKEVLKNVEAHFYKGKVYAVTGRSGIGKTTFLKFLCGLKKADRAKNAEYKAVMGVVFQENRLFGEFSAVENIFATGQCFQEPENVKNLLLELLPKEALSKPVKEYSGGMKRRVEIARALLSEGEIILMDEPFGGLDEETKEQVICFINKYRNNRTVIFTTHSPSDIIKVKAEEYKLWTED